MKTIKKIISGGQTGADQGGLEAAKRFNIPTGGWIPKGFLTEEGPKPNLGTFFDLKETEDTNYLTRTKRNVKWADYTIVFMPIKSRGSQRTWEFAEKMKKSRALITRFSNILGPMETAKVIIQTSKILEKQIVLNIAGNRESKSPGIKNKVTKYLLKVLNEIEKRE